MLLDTARASPLNDAQALRPTTVLNGQGLPCQVRIRLKKIISIRKLHFKTWNISPWTMQRIRWFIFKKPDPMCYRKRTGRTMTIEILDRNIGYEVIYSESPFCIAGVAIVLSEKLRYGLLENGQRSSCLL